MLNDNRTDENVTRVVVFAMIITTFLVVANVWFGRELKGVSWLFPALTAVITGVAGSVYGSHTQRKKLSAASDDQVHAFLNSRKIVLLVDDNKSITRAIELAFEKRDFRGRVRIATSCEEALKMLWQREEPYQMLGLPDVIILDLVWEPEMMQGEAFIRELKKDIRLCEIPIVGLSAHDPTELPKESMEIICEFVPKAIGTDGVEVLLKALAKCTSEACCEEPKPQTKQTLTQRLSHRFLIKGDDYE